MISADGALKFVQLFAPSVVSLLVLAAVLWTREDGILPILIVLLVVAVALIVYLRPARESPENILTRTEIDELLNQKMEVVKYELRVDSNTNLVLNTEEKATFLKDLRVSIASEALKAEIVALKAASFQEFEQRFNTDHTLNSVNRLQTEIQDLSRRGTVALILGILATVSGLIVVGHTIYHGDRPDDLMSALYVYIPRASFAILIVTFGFFFLRLYKQSLPEIKYFQNEITTLEFKALALKVASRTSDSPIYGKILEEISKVERNFILSKDQTTVDIERARIQKQETSDLLDAIQELIKSSKK